MGNVGSESQDEAKGRVEKEKYLMAVLK